MKNAINSLKKLIRSFLRYRLNYYNRSRLINKDFTLFASNCVGGVIYSELKLPFRSPTINLWISPADFIKFCANPRPYLAAEFVSVPSSNPYPVCKCRDITIHAMHYTSLEQAQAAWRRRATRINWNNIFIMMSERDGCTEEDLKKFDKLANPHKIVFVHKPMPEINSAFYLPGTQTTGEDTFHRIVGLTAYDKWNAHRFIDRFDYVEWFNSGIKRLSQ